MFIVHIVLTGLSNTVCVSNRVVIILILFKMMLFTSRMATMIQLFDDLDDVGYSITEADLMWMMTVVRVVMRLLMVSRDWRRGTMLSTVYTATGNNITHTNILC